MRVRAARRSQARPRRCGRWWASAACAAIVLASGCSREASPPVLAVDPGALQLAEGDTSAVFWIRNAGGGTLHWTLECDAPWLSPVSSSGSTRDEHLLLCRVDGSRFAEGHPTASLSVRSDGGDGRVLIHMYRLLSVSPDTLFFADSLVAERLALCSHSAAPLSWRAASDRPWLAVESDSGRLAAQCDTLGVSVSRSGLADGVYEGALMIGAGAYGEDTIHVRMLVGLVGSVRGHVYHAGSRIPIAEVTVRLDARETRTDATGLFVFRDVPAGSWWLSAEREGYEGHGEAIEVPAQGVLRDIQLSSPLYEHVVRGTVRNSLGRPVTHARAALLNPDGTESAIVALSDSQGEYVLACVPEGRRAIRWMQSFYENRDDTLEVRADFDGADATLIARPLPSPFVPDGPVTARQGCRILRVSWPLRYEETVAGYLVERSPAGLDRFVDVSGVLDRTTAAFDDLDLARGNYAYRLRTVNIDDRIGPPSPVRLVPIHPWTVLVLNNSEGPQPRWGHSAIYVPEGDSMVVFAGSGCESGQCGTEFRDLWGLDLATHEWSLVEFVGGPAKRYDHTAVYDRARQRMVLFGGRNIRDASGLGDVWVFDLQTHGWREVEAAGPRARAGHVAVLDEWGDRMIIHGGRTYAAGTGLITLSDVWSFDLATESWELLDSGTGGAPGTRPGPRADHTSALVDQPGRRWMVVHGGIYTGLTAYRDAWAFDLDAEQWIPLPDGPVQRVDAAAGFGSAAGMIVFHGGRDAETGLPLTDVYALALDPVPQWIELDGGPVASRPEERVGQSGIYDPGRSALVICGGNFTLESEMGNDVWSYCLGN